MPLLGRRQLGGVLLPQGLLRGEGGAQAVGERVVLGAKEGPVHGQRLVQRVAVLLLAVLLLLLPPLPLLLFLLLLLSGRACASFMLAAFAL